MFFVPQGVLAKARLLSYLIQHHEEIIKRLKEQQNSLLEGIVEDMSKDYDLNLDTGELTDATERARSTDESFGPIGGKA